MAEAGLSESGSSLDMSQHGGMSPNNAVRNSMERPPRTPQKEWLRATPPPRTLLVTPRQRPRISDSLPEQTESLAQTKQDGFGDKALEDQENDRRLAHQSATPSYYSGYQQRLFRRDEGQNSFLRGSWQPNTLQSFQPSPDRRVSSRNMASNAAPLTGPTFSNSGPHTPLSPLKFSVVNQAPASHFGGMQTPLSPGWGKGSDSLMPQALAPETVIGGQGDEPAVSRRTSVHSVPATAKTLKRVETKVSVSPSKTLLAVGR